MTDTKEALKEFGDKLLSGPRYQVVLFAWTLLMVCIIGSLTYIAILLIQTIQACTGAGA